MEPVVLYLMNQKGWSVLSAVVDQFGPASIRAVVTARDAAMAKDYYNEIAFLCKQYHIEIHERTSEEIPKSTYKIAIGWRWIIEDDNNLIVLHDSLLPRYRGFAPLVNALINGEKEIGVTALFATSEYDQGDIIKQLATTFEYPVKIADAIDQVSSLYEKIVIFIFDELVARKKLSAYKQNEKKATYSLWREEDDYRIDWNKPASFIKRFIDATGFPFKGASAMMENTIIRIAEAEEVADVQIENRDAGKIIFMKAGKPVVVCGTGLIKLNAITTEEGKPFIPFTKFRVRFK